MRLHLAFGGLFGAFVGSLCALPACPGPAPATQPDVVYATPAPFDAGALEGATLSPCQLACVALQRAGCLTFDDCPNVLADVERDRHQRIPDGGFLTCAGLAVAAHPQDLGIGHCTSNP